jgi:hypothetical protein
MQFRRIVGFWVLAGMLLLAGTLLGVMVWRYPDWLGIQPGSERQSFWLLAIAATTLIVVLFLLGYHLLGRELGRSAYRKQDAKNLQPQAARPKPHVAQVAQSAVPNGAYLRERYGFFWRRKVRLLLVVGEPEQIEAIAPGLSEQRWLEGQNTVLLWAGSVQGDPQESLLLQWRGRALNGVVWALSKDQCTDAAAMSAGARRLQTLARALRWQLPLHLWQVGDSAWSQEERDSQPVGCLLPSRVTPLILENSLNSLLGPLRRAGLAPGQVLKVSGGAPQAFTPGAVITGLTTKAARDQSFEATFQAMPYSETVCFRPELKEKPQIAGTVPARVTSPQANDPYAHIDLEGRYRVNFLFDRDSWKAGEESVWLRLARPYAGDTHGLHLPLIAGTEVAIAFEQGEATLKDLD